MDKVKIKRWTQSKFVRSKRVFEACDEIYTDKFLFEFFLDLEGMSGLVFYTYHLDDKIIGYGSYQKTSLFFLVETIFKEEFQYGRHQVALFQYILKEIESVNGKNLNICLYQSLKADVDFYSSQGFSIYKDYGQFFLEGQDRTRWVLEKFSY